MEDEPIVEVVAEQVPTEPVPTEGEPAQPPEAKPAETKPAEPSLADVEARLDEKIRAMQETTRRETEQLLERVKQSGRDTTKAQVEQLKAHYDELYLSQARAINELVKEGTLDPQAATAKKLALREEYDGQALNAAKQARERQPAQADDYQRQQAVAAWQRNVSKTLDLLDMTGQEPEFKKLYDPQRVQNMDWEEADKYLNRIAKQAAKEKEARVRGEAKMTTPTKTAPTVEVGGGKTPGLRNKTSIAQEMEALMLEPGGTPQVRAERKKKLDELEKAWEQAPD